MITSESKIKNKVAQSNLITIDLEQYYTPGIRIEFDIKLLLQDEFFLKEKEFRQFIKDHDWTRYQNAFVYITNSNNAIVPMWVYFSISVALEPFVKKTIFGSLEYLESILYKEKLELLDLKEFENKKIVIKGCSHKKVPTQAYIELITKLKPIANSIMYGEPCSTVPIYKRKERKE